MNNKVSRLLVIALLFSLVLSSCGINQKRSSQAKRATVVEVIDGDTIKVSLDGKLETIRYIGIDTPETKHPSKPRELFGKEAFDFNSGLVEGKEIILKRDVSQRDRYGRLLRYVYVDGLFINAELVRKGYATVSTYPPDVKFASYFLKLQRLAKKENLGLWSLRQ